MEGREGGKERRSERKREQKREWREGGRGRQGASKGGGKGMKLDKKIKHFRKGGRVRARDRPGAGSHVFLLFVSFTNQKKKTYLAMDLMCFCSL
jgi:hypothetical protein